MNTKKWRNLKYAKMLTNMHIITIIIIVTLNKKCVFFKFFYSVQYRANVRIVNKFFQKYKGG